MKSEMSKICVLRFVVQNNLGLNRRNNFTCGIFLRREILFHLFNFKILKREHKMLFLINIKCTYIILCYNQYKERSHKVRKGGKLKTDE